MSDGIVRDVRGREVISLTIVDGKAHLSMRGYCVEVGVFQSVKVVNMKRASCQFNADIEDGVINFPIAAAAEANRVWDHLFADASPEPIQE